MVCCTKVIEEMLLLSAKILDFHRNGIYFKLSEDKNNTIIHSEFNN